MKIEMESFENLNNMSSVTFKSQQISIDQNNNSPIKISIKEKDIQNTIKQKAISNNNQQDSAKYNIQAINSIICLLRDNPASNNDNHSLVQSQINKVNEREQNIIIDYENSFLLQHNKQILFSTSFHQSYICSIHKLPIEYIALNTSYSHYYQNCCRKCVIKQQRTDTVEKCKIYNCTENEQCQCEKNQFSSLSTNIALYFEIDELLVDYTFSFKKFIIYFQESLDLIKNVLQLLNQNCLKQDAFHCFQKISKNLKTIIQEHMRLMGIDIYQFQKDLFCCTSEYSYQKKAISFESIHQCMNFLLNEQKQWEDQQYQIQCFIDSQLNGIKNKRKNNNQEDNFNNISEKQENQFIELPINNYISQQQSFQDQDLFHSLQLQIKLLFQEKFDGVKSSLLSSHNIFIEQVSNKTSSCLRANKNFFNQNEQKNNKFECSIQTTIYLTNETDFKNENINILQTRQHKQLEFEQNPQLSFDNSIKMNDNQENNQQFITDELQIQQINGNKSIQQRYDNYLVQNDYLNTIYSNQKDLDNISENKILKKEQPQISFPKQQNQKQKQEQSKFQFDISNFSCKDIDDIEFIHFEKSHQNVNITYFDFNERYGIFYTMASVPKMFLFDFQNKKIEQRILQNVIQKQELNQIMIVKISSTEIAVWQEDFFQEIIIFNIYSKKVYKFRYAASTCFETDEFGQSETEINLFSMIYGSTLGIQLNNKIHMINYKKKKTIRIYDLQISKHPISQQNPIQYNLDKPLDQQNEEIQSLGNLDDIEQYSNKQQLQQFENGQNVQSQQFQTISGEELDVIEQFEEFKAIINKRTKQIKNCIHQNIQSNSCCQICSNQINKKVPSRYHLYMRSEKLIWQMELHSGRINQWVEKENSQTISQRFYPINENKWFFYKDNIDEQWVTVYKNQLQQGEYLSFKMMEFENPINNKYWPILDINNKLKFFDFQKEQFNSRIFDLETLVQKYQKHIKMFIDNNYQHEGTSLFDNIDSYCFVKTFNQYLVLIQPNGDIYYIK